MTIKMPTHIFSSKNKFVLSKILPYSKYINLSQTWTILNCDGGIHVFGGGDSSILLNLQCAQIQKQTVNIPLILFCKNKVIWGHSTLKLPSSFWYYPSEIEHHKSLSKNAMISDRLTLLDRQQMNRYIFFTKDAMDLAPVKNWAFKSKKETKYFVSDKHRYFAFSSS